MNKKVSWAFGVAGWLLMALGTPSPGNPAEPIPMLALDPLSGVMKDIGDRYQLGIRFAVEEINAGGGLLGRPIKMFYDDSQLKPDVAARKVSRYASEEKVKFIMTGTGTMWPKAMSQVAEKENHHAQLWRCGR
jgi:branched-chain amino acid transport system substrate-binding protein